MQRGERRVALAYIGDGGTNTGDFHEGLNFAAALRLPMVLIVEDNGFAYSTPVAAHVAIDTFAQRAVAYGIPSCTVDGNDVLEVYRATREAVERARGPRTDTDRSQDVSYARSRGARRCLLRAKGTDGVLAGARPDPTPAQLYARSWPVLDALEERITRGIDEAVEWAEQSPLPDPSTQGRVRADFRTSRRDRVRSVNDDQITGGIV
jgi:TPP-dependent pyruvate/acetoin dehydrogenase alpha subunit